jgi:hypothetical protein
MPRKETLALTLADLDRRVREGKGQRRGLPGTAVMLVPSMNWRVEHHYGELEGRYFQNTPALDGCFVGRAYQFIQLKIDRSGVIISSGADMSGLVNGHDEPPNPDHFIFDRPYLLVFQKRGASGPVFVMWVANAELLQPR